MIEFEQGVFSYGRQLFRSWEALRRIEQGGDGIVLVPLALVSALLRRRVACVVNEVSKVVVVTSVRASGVECVP